MGIGFNDRLGGLRIDAGRRDLPVTSEVLAEDGVVRFDNVSSLQSRAQTIRRVAKRIGDKLNRLATYDKLELDGESETEDGEHPFQWVRRVSNTV
jgi:hypothetical protein